MSLLKIGTTSTNLISMPAPTAMESAQIEYSLSVVDKMTTQGDRNVAFAGKEKRTWTLTFEELTRTEFNTLKGYCLPAVPYQYWVQYQDTLGDDPIINGYCYLRVEGAEVPNYGNEFYRNLELLIMEM